MCALPNCFFTANASNHKGSCYSQFVLSNTCLNESKIDMSINGTNNSTVQIDMSTFHYFSFLKISLQILEICLYPSDKCLRGQQLNQQTDPASGKTPHNWFVSMDSDSSSVSSREQQTINTPNKTLFVL